MLAAISCKKTKYLTGDMIYNLKFSSKESSTKLINKTSVSIKDKNDRKINISNS